MKSFTQASFWRHFERLSHTQQREAKLAYEEFRRDPFQASLKFKKLKGLQNVYSVRIGLSLRALATRDGNDLLWYWIGTHADYDKLIG